ncbi:glycosyl hydrolase [Cohnella sp.]|uniref:glycosyl hydrolase n=1 Tax=Cohnella sp. TaxID=1883426 RepID=UPI003569B31F
MRNYLRFILASLVLLYLTGFVGFDKSQEMIRNQQSEKQTVNRGSSNNAKKLLKFLHEIKGKYTLTGMHSFLEKPDLYAEKIKQITGNYPAIKGYELGGILNQQPSQLQKERDGVVKSAIGWHKSGGIVAMTYHIHLPGECYCWKKVNNGGISQEEFKKIITPGTEQYKKHLKDLDDAAIYLKKLRDAGVPVLWRPYHEMNGGWFWWGRQPEFTKLWDIMYKRFTEYHDLNNLLWVWSPGAPDEWSDPFESYYVGSKKADVLALDIYHNKYKKEHHDQLIALAKGKPIAIGENGHLPTPSLLNNDLKSYTWFMAWGNLLEETNSKDVIQTLFKEDRVLNLNEMLTKRKETK